MRYEFQGLGGHLCPVGALREDVVGVAVANPRVRHAPFVESRVGALSERFVGARESPDGRAVVAVEGQSAAVCGDRVVEVAPLGVEHAEIGP